MKFIGKLLNQTEDYLLIILMTVMPIVIFLQIVLRITGSPLSWTEETARYMFLWVIYLGCARGVRNHTELSVDMLRQLLKKDGRARAVYDLITAILCAVFAAVFVRYSVAMIENLIVYPKYSPACQYNMIIVYMSSVVGSILMLIRYLTTIYKRILLVIHPQRNICDNGGEAV